MDIPSTEARFQQMNFDQKNKVKSKLMQRNYSKLCDGLSTQIVRHFAPVLHRGDMEELKLSANRHSQASVISDLLGRISRSLKKNPTWWELLDEVLLEESPELHRALNPWEKGPPAGAAGGADGANEEGRPRGRAHLPPTAHPPADQIVWNARPQDPSPIHRDGPQSPPYKVGLSRSKRASGPQPPYSKDMPLAETHGIHQQLKPLLADGDDMLWRDLAENLGLSLGTQLDVQKQSKGVDHLICRHLLICYIQHFDTAATVGALLDALLSLGPEGQQIVQRMEEAGIIFPVEREGSEAGGQVADVACDSERDGSTSAQALQAPTLRLQPVSGPGLCHTPEDRHESSNLCDGQPFKQSLLPDKPISVVAGEPIDRKQDADEQIEGSASSDSIVDNSSQAAVLSVPVPVQKDQKILNKTVSFQEGKGVEENSTGECRHPVHSLQVDSPGSPLHSAVTDSGGPLDTLPSVPQYIQDTQQQILNQISSNVVQSVKAQHDGSAFYISVTNINKVDKVSIVSKTKIQHSEHPAAEDDDGEGGEREEREEDSESTAMVEPASPVSTAQSEYPPVADEDQFPIPVSEVSQPQMNDLMQQASDNRFSAGLDAGLSQQPSSSFHPPAWDTPAQETHVKHPYRTEENPEEEVEDENAAVATEEGAASPKDMDIVDLRLNSRDSGDSIFLSNPCISDQSTGRCSRDSESSVFFSNVHISDQSAEGIAWQGTPQKPYLMSPVQGVISEGGSEGEEVMPTSVDPLLMSDLKVDQGRVAGLNCRSNDLSGADNTQQSEALPQDHSSQVQPSQLQQHQSSVQQPQALQQAQSPEHQQQQQSQPPVPQQSLPEDDEGRPNPSMVSKFFTWVKDIVLSVE